MADDSSNSPDEMCMILSSWGGHECLDDCDADTLEEIDEFVDELFKNEEMADSIPPLPLGVLVANTQGAIGYIIQQSLQNDVIMSIQAALRGRYDLKINDQLLNNLFQPGT